MAAIFTPGSTLTSKDETENNDNKKIVLIIAVATV